MPDPLDTSDVASSFPELTDVSHLKSGGMKHAYAAVGPAGRVALKIVDDPIVDSSVDAEIDGTTVSLPRRVQLEVSLMKDIDHPNIVRLIDGPNISEICGSDRVWWLEPLYPDSLTNRLGVPWEREQLLDLGAGLLAGVSRLNEANIVHRDIKPPNIMFTAEDQPVLIDLGIAYRSEGTDITGSGEVPPRTLGFMAPEQVLPRTMSPVDFRCDLFLIGINLYLASTTVVPFSPDHPDYTRRLMSGSFDSEALAQADLDACMAAVITRLLSPHAAGRYRTPQLASEAWEACR